MEQNKIEIRGKKSNKTIEELETLCEELEIRNHKIKDLLREISKIINTKLKTI